MPATPIGIFKLKAIIMVETPEHKEYLKTNPIQLTETIKISFVDFETKLCHVCHSRKHLVKDCDMAKIRREAYERKQKNFQHFSKTIKCFQPNLYRTLNRKFSQNDNTQKSQNNYLKSYTQAARSRL